MREVLRVEESFSRRSATKLEGSLTVCGRKGRTTCKRGTNLSFDSNTVGLRSRELALKKEVLAWSKTAHLLEIAQKLGVVF